MTSEGPHHPGQEPDEVSPGAGGSAPYGDRSAQQEQGYGTAAPDLGWAPPPPAARPGSPAPTWSPPGEAPPTVGWKSPGDQQQPAPWGPPGGAGQPWGGQAGPPPAGNWEPQSEQQQPTTAWAAASAPVPQQPAWGQGDAPGAGGQPGWVPQGEAPQQQNWPGQGPAQQAWPAAGDQPARGQQPPAPWGPPPEPAQAAPWSPPEQQPQNWGTPAEQPHQPAAAWGQQPAGGQQGEQPQPGDWGNAPAGQPAQSQPAAWGSAAVRPQGDPQPGAWGSAPQPGGQQPGTWGPADEQPPTAAWGAAGPPQGERPQSGFDTPAEQSRPTEAWQPTEQSRPTEAWQPTEPTSAPPARATASVRVDPGPTWNPGTERGDDAVPARPVVPEGEPWSADEVWGKAGAENPPADSGRTAAWEPPRAESAPLYQPAPGPGISPANAVPLPPQETRVPGASLAASPPADYVPPAPYGEPAGRDGGYEAEQPGDGWGAEAQSAAAAAIPHPRTSPEGQAGGEAGGSITASASVPLSSRVMPPTDQALRPAAMPAPQPRVYGRPAHPADGPDQPDHGGHQQPEPHRFPLDGEPGNRFGGPEQRFDGGPGGHVDGGPGGRFDAPESRFDGGPADRFDGPDQRFDGAPGNRFDERDQPGAFGDGPPVAAAATPVPHPALHPFPPGVPTFADPATNQRPVNGTKPHSEPARPGDRFSGAAAPVSGGATGGPGHGPADATRGFPAAFPQDGDQPERPLWDLGEQASPEQGRFDSFKPEAEETKPAEPPAPKVRNGRVLMAVLTAAVLILVVPLGLLWLLGKTGDSDKTPAFNPAVGTCVKQSGEGAAEAGCGDQGAFKVISKVDNKDKCADPAQPHVVLPGNAADRVLCLAPATAG